jgi:hypothetical protein
MLRTQILDDFLRQICKTRCCTGTPQLPLAQLSEPAWNVSRHEFLEQRQTHATPDLSWLGACETRISMCNSIVRKITQVKARKSRVSIAHPDARHELAPNCCTDSKTDCVAPCFSFAPPPHHVSEPCICDTWGRLSSIDSTGTSRKGDRAHRPTRHNLGTNMTVRPMRC